MDTFHNVQTYYDFDDFTESVTWDLEFAQLGQGKFRANFVFIGDPDVQVAEARYNCTLLQKGAVPRGFTFAVHHPESAPILWWYLDFPANSIIVFPENREHQGISHPHHHPFIVTISKTFLNTVAGEIGLPAVDQFVIQGEVRMCEPSSIRRIQSLLSALCHRLRYWGEAFTDKLLSQATKWNIARLLLLALAPSIQSRPRKRNLSQRKQIVGRVMRHVNADLAQSQKLPELCHIAGVDERTLRNIFYEQFLLSPMKYIKYHRLNSVRSALKEMAAHKRLIADIANDNGFWHMGQFAKDYKKLFGELPSETTLRCKIQRA